MAFNFINLARQVPTQTYEQSHVPASGAVNGTATLNVWTYNAQAAPGSNDSTATVEGANYFLGAIGYLRVGDFIHVAANDAVHILTVTTNNGSNSITTTQLV